ncbi:MAG: nuclear transport factor 2 family protein [Pseudomonadota bacterium]
MAKIPALIQERELGFMHSWMHRDAGEIKKLAARDCVLLFGTDPIEVLDRPSFVAAVQNDFRCLGYRMGECVVRRYGKMAWFTGSADMELKLGVREWKGRFLITGLWQKQRFGGWKLLERTVSPLAQDERLPAGVQRLQMWQR